MPAAGRSDRGETLLELVVAIAIMSTALVAVVGCLVTSVTMSDFHRQQATAGATLRNYAEAITNAVDTGHYPAGCAPLAADFKAPAGFQVPSGFQASIIEYPPADSAHGRFWTGSSWTPACTSDQGLQRFTLQVRSNDSRAVEQLVVVVRKPCGLADALCG